MEMEVSGQNIVTCDEEQALKCLLDAFGSTFSLEEIASVYCKASRNADLAGDMLYEMQGSSSSSSASNSFNSDVRVEESSKSSDGHSLENSCLERKKLRPKARPVAAGSVSSIIGKDYTRSLPSANVSYVPNKPVKLDGKALPMTGIWREKAKPKVLKHDQLHLDMEDFLFKMLGYGFHLERDTIRRVLESCGYDMKKSMDKLLDGSVVALDTRADVAGDSVGRFTDSKPKSVLPSSESNRNFVSNKGVELDQKQKDKDKLQRDVLSALFNGYECPEEPPTKSVKDVGSRSRFRYAVLEPPEDSMEDYKIDLNFSREIRDPEDEEEYQNVRRAVKEYRAAMNEYYKSAVDAFAKGDKVKAEKLLDQGHFFLKKAREADEESGRMILKTKSAEAQEMLLDLHDCDSKEAAIRLLKCHISSLAGIPTFDYLKVIIYSNDQKNTKVSRRRERILKLLEQESIKWVEGETAGTILIRLDSIDRKSLSFLKT